MTEEKNMINRTFAGCEIIEKIGQGGMGSVYKARQISLDKIVCVKILSPQLAKDQRNVDFFLREARSAAKLDHSNIVQVYNFGQEDGTYFIVMSHIEGRSLADVIKEKGPLSIEKASDVMIGVLKGLEHAHSKTIIHRDIKPENILLAKNGEPKIVDFGLARSITEEKELTLAGEMIGTAYFMSPEQGLAQKADHRADIYSVGATYFYLITGKYPFEGKSAINVIGKHISDPLPNLFMILPEAPIWVSRILEKLMSKKPEDRYQTALEAMNDFIKYKDPENVKKLYTNESSIELPEVTSSLQKKETKQASPEKSAPAKEAPVYSRDDAPVKQDNDFPAVHKERVKPAKLPLQLVFLNNAVKIATHFSLTLAIMTVFVLLGCLPAKTVVTTQNMQSFLGPLANNPMKSVFFMAAGIGLMIWAIGIKPKKFSFFRAVIITLVAVFSYIAGSLALSPGNFDMVSKTFFVVKSSISNLFAKNNIIPYSFFCLILGSIFSMKEDWKIKLPGIILSAISVNLTYRYFLTDLYTEPDHIMLGLTIASLLIGTIVSITRKNFSILMNPAVFFIISNLLVFFVLSGPQVNLLAKKINKQDKIKFQKQTMEARAWQRRLLESTITEYDQEGRPIEAKIEKPYIQPLKSADELKHAATKKYYAQLLFSFNEIALKTGGFLIVSLLLLIILNTVFVNGLFNRGQEGYF